MKFVYKLIQINSFYLYQNLVKRIREKTKHHFFFFFFILTILNIMEDKKKKK